jgi:hypothetical protein
MSTPAELATDEAARRAALMRITEEINPTVPNLISAYIQCDACLREAPVTVPLREYAQLEFGVTADGHLQVWCRRHNCNVGVFTLCGCP